MKVNAEVFESQTAAIEEAVGNSIMPIKRSIKIGLACFNLRSREWYESRKMFFQGLISTHGGAMVLGERPRDHAVPHVPFEISYQRALYIRRATAEESADQGIFTIVPLRFMLVTMDRDWNYYFFSPESLPCRSVQYRPAPADQIFFGT
jgi:hypothetical protein